MNPVATSDAAFRGGACPTPEYTVTYTGNYTTSADASGDKTAILHAAAKAEQAAKWLRQFDPALTGDLKEAA